MDQLVEILARALSPGVNDAFTATTCIDWIQAGLTKAVLAREPETCVVDDENRPRVIVPTTDFQSLVSAAIDQSIQYGAGDRNAALHLMEMIATLASVALRDKDRDLLVQYAEALAEAADALLPLRRDRDEIHARLLRVKSERRRPVSGLRNRSVAATANDRTTGLGGPSVDAGTR